MTIRRLALGLAAAVSATPALAHTGGHILPGFADGFLHPIGGADHVLAMVTVGLFAAMLGGRTVWAVPGTFVGMMLVGGALGMNGIQLPAVETGIGLSIVVLGALVVLGRSWPVGAAMALVGIFAVFHGHAHGAEIVEGADAFSYSTGFALATAGLHGLGVALGLLVLNHRAVLRLSGAAVALSGFYIAFI
jgi:urease accessory protein